MKTHVLILGAGFGGLELSTLLSEAAGDRLDITLIDRNDHFVFGFSKLEVMFHRTTPDRIRMHYRDIARPGVRFVQDQVESIDPIAKRVITSGGEYEGDIMVVALGADYDLDATPGLKVFGNEFYTVPGAIAVRNLLPDFTRGNIVIGISSAPYKCPPAPSETALMLHDYLTTRGVRESCSITLVTPFGVPIPPSPETSQAIKAAFMDRGIALTTNNRVVRLDGERKVAVLDGGSEVPFDLYLGVPKHRIPQVVAKSEMADEGWIPVDPKSLKTRFENVYAIGDVANIGVPKAGVFAEGAAQVVAAAILRDPAGGPEPPPFTGSGSCYIEYGFGKVGRVDIDFLSGPAVAAVYHEPTTQMMDEKIRFGASRRARWFNGG